jgi:hypothetical protein
MFIALVVTLNDHYSILTEFHMATGGTISSVPNLGMDVHW